MSISYNSVRSILSKALVLVLYHLSFGMGLLALAQSATWKARNFDFELFFSWRFSFSWANEWCFPSHSTISISALIHSYLPASGSSTFIQDVHPPANTAGPRIPPDRTLIYLLTNPVCLRDWLPQTYLQQDHQCVGESGVGWTS